jgi:hypothetical protein
VADLFFADQFTAPVSAPVAPASSSPPAAARVAFSGPPTFEARMFSDELDTSWALALWSNGARIIKRNQVEIVLTRGERADTYEAPGLSIRLGRDGAGVVSGMVVDAGAITGVTFVRVR